MVLAKINANDKKNIDYHGCLKPSILPVWEAKEKSHLQQYSMSQDT
jgi:hypothetical protein